MFVPAAPTATEDLSAKPAAQAAFREAYYSGYGPAAVIQAVYERNAQRYRDLYYRLHAEVDYPIDRVRRAVTEGGSTNAVLVRTSDHGDLLGAHGGLHQKWFNLYDEATRVPFTIVRIGQNATAARAVAVRRSGASAGRSSGPSSSARWCTRPPCAQGPAPTRARRRAGPADTGH